MRFQCRDLASETVSYLLHTDSAGERGTGSGLELGRGALPSVFRKDLLRQGLVLLPLSSCAPKINAWLVTDSERQRVAIGPTFVDDLLKVGRDFSHLDVVRKCLLLG